MIELLLFLGTFCLLCFLPVQFVISFTNENWQSRATVELSFLNGLLQRKKEIQFQTPTVSGFKTKTVKQGRWFWIKKRTSPKESVSWSENGDGLREFLDRYRHLGVGITLLSYFLPARYYKWLLVAENLERRGQFNRLSWVTRVGTDNPAFTALGIGMLWGIKETFIGYLRSRYEFVHPPEVDVFGNFQNAEWRTAFNCIFRVKLGYIIIAALMVRFRHAWRKGGVASE